ncbi:rRNA-processing protein [Coemansia sp. RSA 552]|nr:rRNA-processing protein [Coemansia sp. RSA 552]
MISALAWVRKGVAAARPTRTEMTEEEYTRMQEEAAGELEEAKKELKERQALDDEIRNDPALKDFDLENYDSDGSAADGEEEQGGHIFSNVKGLSFYGADEEDPDLAKQVEDDEESDGDEILETDSMLLVAKTEDGISNIEVCVFEAEEDNLFVHHDFMLPAFPLAVEWLDYHVAPRRRQESGSGNYVAVATFEPRIEIWDLDAAEATFPDLVLGASDKRALRKARGKPNDEFHTDAVMGLAWNRHVRNLLASSSADTTVKLWDLGTGKCAQSYTHHSGKVQAVQWHPHEASVMLTGAYDRRVAALDSRAPTAISWWDVDADVESLLWDAHAQHHFYVATESGTVRYFDARSPGASIFTLVAHDEAVSAMDQHPSVAGILVTGSADETVKVWDVRAAKPSMVLSRNLDVGSVFAAKFCPDEPMLLAIGGSSGESKIWDLSTNAHMRSTYGDAQTQAAVVREKPVMGVQRDDDDNDDSRAAVISELRGGTKDPDSDQEMGSGSD